MGKRDGKKGGKKAIIIGCAFLLLAAGGGGCFYVLRQRQGAQETAEREERMPQAGDGQEVTASAVTSFGITEETVSLDDLDAELVIEEVFVHTGDTVETGSPILRLSDASIEQARRELTRKAARADLLFRQGQIDYRLSVLEAKEACDVTELEAQYAQSDYEAALAQAQETVDARAEELEDAQEQYEEYDDAVSQDSYRETYGLDEKKAAWEEHEQLYWDTLKAWHIKDKEVGNSGGGEDSGGESGGGEGGSGEGGRSGSGGSSQAASVDRAQRIAALEQMEDLYRAEKEAYEDALAEYETALETAKAGLEDAKVSMELAQTALSQAQLDYTRQAEAARETYETTLWEAENAETAYRSRLQQLEEELEELESERDETAEQAETFERVIGDGCLYTSGGGTVVLVSVSGGEKLEPDSVVLAYSDPSALTVTAAVDQSDIARLSVGEEAVVLSEDGDVLAAQIDAIDPQAAFGGSRASVTYAVTLSLTGGEAALPANETVTVRFGVSAEEYTQRMQQRMQQREQRASEEAQNGGVQNAGDGARQQSGGGADAQQSGGGADMKQQESTGTETQNAGDGTRQQESGGADAQQSGGGADTKQQESTGTEAKNGGDREERE